MRRRELKILGLSYSQTQLGSYVIVLSDKVGKKKLPIIIKPAEAQRIAIEIEGIKSSRPMIHDLFKTMTDFYGLDVQEVFIHNILEGIFYTKIKTTNGLDEVDMECTAGDAIALSVIYGCPIYTTSEILNDVGVAINDDGSPILEGDTEDLEDEVEVSGDLEDNLDRIVSVEDLDKMMNDAIGEEDYLLAARLRDRITELRG